MNNYLKDIEKIYGVALAISFGGLYQKDDTIDMFSYRVNLNRGILTIEYNLINQEGVKKYSQLIDSSGYSFGGNDTAFPYNALPKFYLLGAPSEMMLLEKVLAKICLDIDSGKFQTL